MQHLRRTIAIERGSDTSDGDHEISMAFASELPYERWWGIEVLQCTPDAVRLERLNDGAPVLFNHDWDALRGVHVKGATKADKDGVVRGKVRLTAATQDGRDTIALVKSGVLTKASVGYQIHKIVEKTKKKDGSEISRTYDGRAFEDMLTRAAGSGKGGGSRLAFLRSLDSTVEGEAPERAADDEPTFLVVDWEPYENSLVTVPADPTVGVGRSRETPAPEGAGPPGAHANADPEARSERASSFPAQAASRTTDSPAARAAQETTMSDADKTAAAGSAAEKTGAGSGAGAPSQNAIELEGQRRKAIENFARSSNIPDNIRDMWITSGASVERVSDDILKITEERGKNTPKSVARLDLSASEAKQFSVLGAIRAIADKDWSKAGFEAECSREIASRLGKQPDPNKFFIPLDVQERAAITRRALAMRDGMAGDPRYGQRTADTVAVPSQGGYLVDTVQMSFIEILRNRTVAYALGARRLAGLVGNVTIPRQTGAATASWMTSESTQISATNQTFGQIALTPKTIGAYTEISRLLLLQSSPDAEGLINADLAAVTAIGLDSAVLTGSGANGAPVGIINTAGVGAIGACTTFDFPKLLSFQSTVAAANVRPTSGAYATTPSVAALAMARVKFANTATPLWDGNVWDARGADGCCGYPGMSSVQVPSQNIIFGDWAQIIVGEWGVLEVEVNPYANFQAGIIGVRTLMTADVALRYPQAFAFGTGAT